MNQGQPSVAVATSLKRRWSLHAAWESCIGLGLFSCATISVVTTACIVWVLFSGAVFAIPPATAFFQYPEVNVFKFLTGTKWTPDSGDGSSYGILPLLSGTLLVTGIGGLVGLPVGLASAIYLSEYASPRVRGLFKPTLELLAGIPTIVYGFFALNFITPRIIAPVCGLFGGSPDIFNALSGGLVVGIMIVPTICSLSEDVLSSVPRSLREAGYALGSTKFDVITKIVVPSALSGIMSAFLLGISRAIGETMAVTIAAGNRAEFTVNPLRQIQTMTAYIVNQMKGEVSAGTVGEASLYAVGLMLFLITLSMNLLSQWILRRFREAYQ